jgi:hypothetical protein
MDEPQFISFEPWADPDVDEYDCKPNGTYSRLAWLPIIGPSSWLLWGTLATQLRREPRLSWELTALAEAHGISRGTGQHGMVRRSLHRLGQFHLVDSLEETGHHLVRLTAPPVSERQLQRLPHFVGELHRQTFAQVPRRMAG